MRKRWRARQRTRRRTDCGSGWWTRPAVTPSEIWATREFKEQLEQRPTLYGVSPLRPADEGEDPDATHFNVRKPDSDGRDILVELFRIGPRG